MLSRVADAVHWMARYIERAENVARFVSVDLHLRLDLPEADETRWRPLVVTSGDLAVFESRYGEATEANVRRFLTFDPQNPNSILSCLRAARENARSVREIISSEMWEQVNRAYLAVRDPGAPAYAEEDPQGFYTDVKVASHLFLGLTDTTMTHGEAWDFARLGRQLERADKTSRILDVKYFILLPRPDYVGTPYDTLQWTALLKSASAYEMFRKQHDRISPDRVVKFLTLDRRFPRSVRYCVVEAEESLRRITGTPAGSFENTPEQRLGRLRADLDYADVDGIIRGGLHEYLDTLQSRLNEVGDAIHAEFFARRPPSQRQRQEAFA